MAMNAVETEWGCSAGTLEPLPQDHERLQSSTNHILLCRVIGCAERPQKLFNETTMNTAVRHGLSHTD